MNKLISDEFMKLINFDMEIHKNTYLYETIKDDHNQKLDADNSGYYKWLSNLLVYLRDKYTLKSNTVLDLGCGTGELTVWMRKMGYDAYGIDLHEQHIKYARVLASENDLAEDMFVLGKDNKLPFEDRSIDVVTMFSVLEHIDDESFKALQKEIKRVCRGVVFVLVPNLLKPSDDHTGLLFVPWLPRKIAEFYIKLRGSRFSYYISNSKKWDVYYRTLTKIRMLTEEMFVMDYISDDLIMPQLSVAPPVTNVSKRINVAGKSFRIGVKFPLELLSKIFSVDKQYFYKYLNFVLRDK